MAKKKGEKMKKFVIFTVVLMLSFVIMNSNYQGISAKNSNVVYESEQITDYDTLLKMAKKELKNESKINIASELKIKKNGEEYVNGEKVKVYEYTQKLKKVKNSNGDSTTTYVTNVFTVIDDGSGGGVTPPDFDSSQYRSGWDGSIGVKASMRIFWTEYYDGYIDMTYYGLVQVEGEWEVQDIQLYITNKEVLIGISGITYQVKPYLIFSRTVTKYPTYLDFMYQPPSDWPLVVDHYQHALGAIMSCTIHRESVTWEFSLHNQVIYDIYT